MSYNAASAASWAAFSGRAGIKPVHSVADATVKALGAFPGQDVIVLLGGDDKDTDLMERICLIMDEEQLYLRCDLKLQDVAVRLNTNSSYVSECINSIRSQSFSQFVNTYRVARAQELLRNEPDIKIAEVWVKAGFSSEASFYRIFKAFTGTTPIAWKAEVH